MTDGAEPQPIAFPPAPALIGPSQATHRARVAFARATDPAGPVLIASEPGLDPAGVARAIHDASRRTAHPFTCVECRTEGVPEVECVIEAGAVSGTVLLANLEALPDVIQARLARMLQNRKRIPGLIAAVNSPERAMRQGRLRRDLGGSFAVRLDVPPLRHRRADIPMLIGRLVGESASSAGVPIPAFSREALTLLAALPWRRNLDELRDVLDVLVRAAVGETVRLEDVLEHIPIEPLAPGQVATRNLREARLSFERHYITTVLNRHRGRMADAARILGIQRPNLYRKVRQLGISNTRPRSR